MFALGWFVLVRTDSPWLVIMVGFAGTAPMLLLGLFGGYLADSFPRQRLFVFTQLACLGAAMGMTVLLASGAADYRYAYLMALVLGGAWALDMPSRRSAIHDLLGAAGVTNGLALDTMGMSASRMLGPALAGVIIWVWDFQGVYVAVTVCYLVEVALLARFQVRGVQRDSGPSNFLTNLLVGVRYVRGNPTLRAVVMVTITMNLVLFPYMHLVPVVAREVLNTGAVLAGVLQGASGFGALVGAAFVASATNIRNHGRIYIAGSILSLVTLLVFAVSRWYALSLPALVVLGFGTAGFSTMQATLIMLVAEREMRGKALGVVTIAIGTGPLGTLSLAAITTAVSAPFALGLNAIAGTVALLVIGLTMRSLARPTVESEGAGRTAPQ